MNSTQDASLIQCVIECATEVHRRTGPGLFDDAYETCLAIELERAGLRFERGRLLRPEYQGRPMDLEFQVDFVIADRLVVEVEAVDRLDTVHEAQLRTYVQCGGFPAGITLNFNTVELADGIFRAEAHTRPSWISPPEGEDVFEDPDLWR